MPKRVVLSWSSGKDSAWALHRLQESPEFEVSGLLTTVNVAFDRVAMHGVRREILLEQARACELPLTIVEIPFPCTNEQYEAAFLKGLQGLAEDSAVMAFGDLFLEDVRAYREELVSRAGWSCLFPIWGEDTRDVAQAMIEEGIRARVACLDPRKVPREMAGRSFDASFLADLPADVDPCGENGEFHTCVHEGPMFRSPFDLEVGPTVDREGFLFTDLSLGSAARG